MPDIDMYFWGYLYLFAKGKCQTRKFSCTVDTREGLLYYKIYNDRILLKKMDVDDNNDILSIKSKIALTDMDAIEDIGKKIQSLLQKMKIHKIPFLYGALIRIFKSLKKKASEIKERKYIIIEED